jgi:hypothetical protein
VDRRATSNAVRPSGAVIGLNANARAPSGRIRRVETFGPNAIAEALTEA